MINKIELVLRINGEDVKILPDSASNYWLVAPIPADMKDVKDVKITVERLDESKDSELGEWERLGENATVCSKCGKGLQDSHGYGFVLNEFVHCPFCGREMKVRNKSE